MSEQNNILKLVGPVTLKDVKKIKGTYYEVIDASEAEFGEEEEKWQQVLGYTHHGPVYGREGERTVEVLTRFIEKVWTDCLILPASAKRRHLNRAITSQTIRMVQVSPDSTLFGMRGDLVTNKKGTKIFYDPTSLPSVSSYYDDQESSDEY